ncbi:MAG: hypothetical protein CL661_07345 [Bacteroidetes bacterium]|nr:hypothetical protein [Bacteroidota bacterium]|tara:strand:- start:2199 stop:2939 length:741 start_codon:yes stop_codon:yes gene_type:complete
MDFLDSFYVMLIVFGFASLGGFVGSFVAVPAILKKGINHFIAGILILAMSSELIPEALKTKLVWQPIVGFVAGTVVMFILQIVSRKMQGARSSSLNLALLGAVAIDFLVDGFLSIATYRLNESIGMLIVVVISIGSFFLMLSTANTFKSKISTVYLIALTLLTTLSLIVGGIAGFFASSNQSPGFMSALLTFAAAAFLFLAVEELIPQAHESASDEENKPKNLWIKSMLFGGFLLMLVFRIVQDNG